ncbi:hypothetical protein D3C71_2123090 [compost metagenome]
MLFGPGVTEVTKAKAIKAISSSVVMAAALGVSACQPKGAGAGCRGTAGRAMGDTVSVCVAVSGTVFTPLKNYLVSLSVEGL